MYRGEKRLHGNGPRTHSSHQGLTARVDYGLLIFLSGIFMIGYYKGCDCLSQIGTSGLSLPPLPVAGWYQIPPP